MREAGELRDAASLILRRLERTVSAGVLIHLGAERGRLLHGARARHRLAARLAVFPAFLLAEGGLKWIRLKLSPGRSRCGVRPKARRSR